MNVCESVRVFAQDGSIWTVSPGSSTPFALEILPVTAWASTAIGCGVVGPVVIRPILLAPFSVNQRLPSGPAVMPKMPLLAVGIENSVTTPAVVIRPIWLALSSVNQRLPSGPAAIPPGLLTPVGIGNSVTTPAGVIRADLVAIELGKPEVAVRAGRDAARTAVGGGDWELGDDAGRRDPADLVRRLR